MYLHIISVIMCDPEVCLMTYARVHIDFGGVTLCFLFPFQHSYLMGQLSSKCNSQFDLSVCWDVVSDTPTFCLFGMR